MDIFAEREGLNDTLTSSTKTMLNVTNNKPDFKLIQLNNFRKSRYIINAVVSATSILISAVYTYNAYEVCHLTLNYNENNLDKLHETFHRIDL